MKRNKFFSPDQHQTCFCYSVRVLRRHVRKAMADLKDSSEFICLNCVVSQALNEFFRSRNIHPSISISTGCDGPNIIRIDTTENTYEYIWPMKVDGPTIHYLSRFTVEYTYVRPEKFPLWTIHLMIPRTFGRRELSKLQDLNTMFVHETADPQ